MKDYKNIRMVYTKESLIDVPKVVFISVSFLFFAYSLTKWWVI